jgi:hypothetical protein
MECESYTMARELTYANRGAIQMFIMPLIYSHIMALAIASVTTSYAAGILNGSLLENHTTASDASTSEESGITTLML